MADVEDFIVDFRKEDKSGGGRFKVKDGVYGVTCKAAKPTTAKNQGTPGLLLTLVITSEGRYKGRVFTETLWATPKAYSRFRGLLEAIDEDIPQKINLVKLARLCKGKSFYVELETEEDQKGKYKPRSRVAFEGFINESDYDPDDEGDEDDDDLEDDEDDEGEDDDADDDEDDEDEDEEPEPPKRKARKKAEPVEAKKKRKKAVEDDDDEDDDDIDLDNL